MNFSKEGAQSEKVHQVEPRIKKIFISRYSLARFKLGVTGWQKMILPINCIIVANVDGLE